MYDLAARTPYEDRGRTTIPEWLFSAVSRAAFRSLAERSLRPIDLVSLLPEELSRNQAAIEVYERIPIKVRNIVIGIIIDILKRDKFILQDQNGLLALSEFQRKQRRSTSINNNVMAAIYTDYALYALEKPNRYLTFLSSPKKESLEKISELQKQLAIKLKELQLTIRQPQVEFPHDEPPDNRERKSYAKQRVFFMTNRQRLGDGSFGSIRSDVCSFGSVEVSIPEFHVPGRTERPLSFTGFEVREDPHLHFVVLHETLISINSSEFYRLVNKGASQLVDEKQALLFVHGFNVSFDDSVRRTAQLAYDLGFKGPAIAFSWPSQAALHGYPADENHAMASVIHLEDLLTSLKFHGFTDIQVLAHSMGSKIVVDASRKSPYVVGMQEVGPVVLAAPDIDAGIFQINRAAVCRLATSVTLYASQHDMALRASTEWNGYMRAGFASPMGVWQGIESIDASHVNTDWLGHGYYCACPEILKDIKLALAGNLPPRDALEEVTNDKGEVYWRFPALRE